MSADIAYTIRDGNVVAGISLTPTIYPGIATISSNVIPSWWCWCWWCWFSVGVFTSNCLGMPVLVV